jgi:hypothetical protein
MNELLFLEYVSINAMNYNQAMIFTIQKKNNYSLFSNS